MTPARGYVRSSRVRWVAASVAAAMLIGWVLTGVMGWIYLPAGRGGTSVWVAKGCVGVAWESDGPGEKFGPGWSRLPGQGELDFGFEYRATPRTMIEGALWPAPLTAFAWTAWCWRRRGAGCVGCGYAVEGLAVCPECGRSPETVRT